MICVHARLVWCVHQVRFLVCVSTLFISHVFDSLKKFSGVCAWRRLYGCSTRELLAVYRLVLLRGICFVIGRFVCGPIKQEISQSYGFQYMSFMCSVQVVRVYVTMIPMVSMSCFPCV